MQRKPLALCIDVNELWNNINELKFNEEKNFNLKEDISMCKHISERNCYKLAVFILSSRAGFI